MIIRFSPHSKKVNPSFLPASVPLGAAFINITPATRGAEEQRSGAAACQRSQRQCLLQQPPHPENTLLIGFRYLQNDLFNGITTRIMILFMREAIQALGRADNAFPALWQLMLCYRGR